MPDGRDRAAFERVFEAHQKEVVTLAYMLCGDAETARDAAAEAFARTYEQWRRGRVVRVEGYVRRAVTNQVNSHFRRVGRQRAFERRRAGEGRAATPHVEKVEARDRVRGLIRQLPARQRTAVVLRYWADLPDAEIAEMMGCPLGTAKSLLARGMARLREAAELSSDVEGEGR